MFDFGLSGILDMFVLGYLKLWVKDKLCSLGF